MSYTLHTTEGNIKLLRRLRGDANFLEMGFLLEKLPPQMEERFLKEARKELSEDEDVPLKVTHAELAIEFSNMGKGLIQTIVCASFTDTGDDYVYETDVFIDRPIVLTDRPEAIRQFLLEMVERSVFQYRETEEFAL